MYQYSILACSKWGGAIKNYECMTVKTAWGWDVPRKPWLEIRKIFAVSRITTIKPLKMMVHSEEISMCN